MSVRPKPLNEVFGAEIEGVDIAAGVGEAAFGAIERAFEEHSLLVFRDQGIDEEAQLAFSRRFGPLETTLPGVANAGGEIIRVSNLMPDGSPKDPDSHLALFARANTFWHTDSSFRAPPARASLLAARILPDEGGDTEFASTRAAYEALSGARQAKLDKLIAVHSIAHSRDKIDPAATTPEQREALPPVPQALVRENPVTGRRSLLIGAHVTDIVGIEITESEKILAELLAIATRPEHTYRHRRRVGDLVMWDNRAVLHRGHAYDGVGARRLLTRTTIAGAGPTVENGYIVEARRRS